MKAFVSGQLKEKGRIRAVYTKLAELGIEVTHDWTTTDNLSDYSRSPQEAGRRAALDLQGVCDANVYILMTDNENSGKGMYAELGAALALAAVKGAPAVCIVGPKHHESIFYYHPLAHHFANLDSCLDYLMKVSEETTQAGLHPGSMTTEPHQSYTEPRIRSNASYSRRPKDVSDMLDLLP